MRPDSTAARRSHYRHFYAGTAPSASPLVVVGNCQAESVRLLLDPEESESVRVPPVFELDGDDVARLQRLLARASALVVQPVRDDYRGLPLGTRQLRDRLAPSAGVVVVPLVRFAGVHPCQVVHHPPDGTPPPPVVPYHDLRTARSAVVPMAPAAAPLTPAAVLAVATESLDELRRREARTDVAVSDVLSRPEPHDMRTVNHPGNRVLVELARRVAARLGRPAPVDPGRPLLDAVVAPVERAVSEAWGWPEHADEDCWVVEGVRVAAHDVAAAHLQWYAEHPHVARAVWERFRTTVRLAGLSA